jgi:Sugar phosphate isomerases/epimerases
MNNKLGCSTHCYNKFAFERALQGILDAGVKYVEVGAIPGHCDHVKPEEMDKAQMKEVKRKIESYGLKPLSVSGHCDLTTQKGVELFKKRIDLACELEVEIVNTIAGHAESPEEEEAFFENIKGLVKYLKERDITVAVETHGGIMGLSKDCRKTMERINSKYVGVNYDPANAIYFVGARPEEDIIGIVDHIVHFHIKEKLEGKGVWNFPAIGDGYIDFKKLFAVLSENNYNGPVSFEIEFTPKGPQIPEEVDMALKKSVKHITEIMKSF